MLVFEDRTTLSLPLEESYPSITIRRFTLRALSDTYALLKQVIDTTDIRGMWCALNSFSQQRRRDDRVVANLKKVYLALHEKNVPCYILQRGYVQRQFCRKILKTPEQGY